MDPLLRYARQKQNDIIATIRTFVECESPSDDPPSVNRMVDLIADNVNGFAKVRTFPAPGYGKLLRCEFSLPGLTNSSSKKRGEARLIRRRETVEEMLAGEIL